MKRVKALPRHAVDDHSQCDFHPLVICSCGKCKKNEPIKCEGKAYKTRFRLDCKFHTLLYEIECHTRADQVKEIIHPVLKRGHSNSVEASHNVFIRFRSKYISIQRLHYNLSTNLALLQANLTYMHAIYGTKYHWIPEVFRRMGLPIFEGAQEALETHSLGRKRYLKRAQTTPVKKRRIELKNIRTQDLGAQSGPKNTAVITHGHGDKCVSDHEEDKQSMAKTKAKIMCSACGSSTHKRTTHRDCPFNSAAIMDSDGEGSSVAAAPSSESESDSFELTFGGQCTCGSSGRTHKRV